MCKYIYKNMNLYVNFEGQRFILWLGELLKVLLGVGFGERSLGRNEESKYFEECFVGGKEIMVVGKEDFCKNISL